VIVTNKGIKRLQIKLLSVHTLDISPEEDEEAIQDGIEVFLNLVAGETKIGLDYESLTISSTFTNAYWELMPDLSIQADQDQHGIWQQMIWEIEGEFRILDGMSAEEAAASISWELIFQHDFTEEQIEEPTQYFKVLGAEILER
jgi:hypothetical protein